MLQQEVYNNDFLFSFSKINYFFVFVVIVIDTSCEYGITCDLGFQKKH